MNYDHGTRESTVVFSTKEMIIFAQKYYENIPDIDAQCVRKFCPENDIKQTKLVLCMNRFANRICNRFARGCQNTTRDHVISCPVCAITFYCSENCRSLDSAKHAALRCMHIKDAELDDGPLGISLIQTSN